MYIGNTPFQGLVGGGNILDASIEGVDLSTSAIAARLGYTPVDPGAAVFSANPTISSGTANGIAYLNGSKVVTSGSALSFDGSTLSINNGVTSASVSLIGTYAGSGTVAFLNFQRVGGAVAGTLGYDDSINSIRFGTTTNHSTVFLQNNAEVMRLASTGLGIGLGGSNPSAKLHVKGTEYAQIIETASTTDNDAIRLALKAPGAQSQVELEWWNDSTKTGGGYGLIQTGKTGNSPSFNFMVGKLGIGTINPANKLEVYQSDAGLGAAKILHVNGNYINVQPSYNYYAAYNHIFQSLSGTTEYGRFTSNGDLNVGTTVGGAKLIVGTSETKGQNATPFSLTTSDASNRFDLVVARNTNSYYSFQAVEQNVAYRNIVLQQDGGRVGIGQTDPQEKLDVNGNIYIHTATGNPYLKIKTDGAGNNPTIRLQADTNYWDIQGTFSNTHDDLQFLYNGVNKFAFGNNSIGGLSISNGNNQYGRLTVDTDGHQHVVRGGGLNGGDYYYRFLKLFKLRVSTNSGGSTEVKGRLHLSRVNEIGVSTMVDFYATQGYSTQIRTWYKRVTGPEGAANFRFVTLVDGGNTYLCLEFISAPGWNSWQFEGSVIDFDGGRGSFAVTSVENLTTKEVGPWTSTGADPSVPLLQDTTYGPNVNGIFNYDYTPAGTNVTVASTHIFGAPQTSGGYGEALRITSTGKVGIGLTSPTAPLHINGSVNDSIVASSSTVKFGTAGGDGIAMGSLTSSPWGSWIQSGYLTDGYSPAWNSGYPLILNPAGGNVSVGSNRTPAEKLDVSGNIKFGSNSGLIANAWTWTGTPVNICSFGGTGTGGTSMLVMIHGHGDVAQAHFGLYHISIHYNGSLNTTALLTGSTFTFDVSGGYLRVTGGNQNWSYQATIIRNDQ